VVQRDVRAKRCKTLGENPEDFPTGRCGPGCVGQLRGRVGPRAGSPRVSLPDQVLGVSVAQYTNVLFLVYYREWWEGETKRNERDESGGEVEVL